MDDDKTQRKLQTLYEQEKLAASMYRFYAIELKQIREEIKVLSENEQTEPVEPER